jgi:predicted RNA binding protein YcfA (HicA-like mRNA interferase family)
VRTPRDLSGKKLIRGLGKLGYEETRQSGSHVRLTRQPGEGSDEEEHHVTVPLHNPLRVGTLNAILGDVAGHLGMSKDEVIRAVT